MGLSATGATTTPSWQGLQASLTRRSSRMWKLAGSNSSSSLISKPMGSFCLPHSSQVHCSGVGSIGTTLRGRFGGSGLRPLRLRRDLGASGGGSGGRTRVSIWAAAARSSSETDCRNRSSCSRVIFSELRPNFCRNSVAMRRACSLFLSFILPMRSKSRSMASSPRPSVTIRVMKARSSCSSADLVMISGVCGFFLAISNAIMALYMEMSST
jgi:hypothetical protein